MRALATAPESRALHLQLVLVPGLWSGYLHMECRFLQRPGRVDKSRIPSGPAHPGLGPQACVDQISIRGAEAAARVARPTACPRRNFLDSRVMRRLLRQPHHRLGGQMRLEACSCRARSFWPWKVLPALHVGMHSHARKGCRIESTGPHLGSSCQTGLRDDDIRAQLKGWIIIQCTVRTCI